MIDCILRPLCVSAPIIRFRERNGGFLNAFGGGKVKYEKGSHYKVDINSKHPFNIITEELYE